MSHIFRLNNSSPMSSWRSRIFAWKDSWLLQARCCQHNEPRARGRNWLSVQWPDPLSCMPVPPSGRTTSLCPRHIASFKNLRTPSQDLFHSLLGESGRSIYHICSSSSPVATPGMPRIVLTKPLTRPGHNRQKNADFQTWLWPLSCWGNLKLS